MPNVPQLKPGEAAPAFRASDQDGRTVSSDDLRGTRTVLYFFPKADTAG
jgi:thioredoxin-dependent peroxiredoxin